MATTNNSQVPIHPPFDGQSPTGSSRILNIQQPLSGTVGVGADNVNLPITTLQRGYMKQENAIGSYGGPITFNFLYNPSTVTGQYTVQTSGAGITYLYANPADAANLAAPVTGSVSFTVLFDRTYDLWQSYNTDGSAKNAGSAAMQQWGNDPTVVGCWADIMQLMRFVGMYNTGQSSPNAASVLGSNFASGGAQSTSQGFMFQVPCWTYFGPQNKALQVYGYVSAWDYTVTHWSQYMVPMRCSIDITITPLPAPNYATGLPWSLGSASADATQAAAVKGGASTTSSAITGGPGIAKLNQLSGIQ